MDPSSRPSSSSSTGGRGRGKQHHLRRNNASGGRGGATAAAGSTDRGSSAVGRSKNHHRGGGGGGGNNRHGNDDKPKSSSRKQHHNNNKHPSNHHQASRRDDRHDIHSSRGTVSRSGGAEMMMSNNSSSPTTAVLNNNIITTAAAANNGASQQQCEQQQSATASVEPAASSLSSSSVTNIMDELSTQMQLINDTIGNSLSNNNNIVNNTHNNNNSGVNNRKQCQQCHTNTTTLLTLQSQIQLAIKRFEKMTMTLTVLQTHSNLVNASLMTLKETLAEEVGAMKEAAAIEEEEEEETDHNDDNTVAVAVEQQQQQQQQQQTELPPPSGWMVNNNDDNHHHHVSTIVRTMNGKRLPPQSYPPAATNNVAVASTTAAANMGGGSPTTLESLIHQHCAPYLTISPGQYCTWLQNELDVRTIDDFVEAFTDCPEDLVGGSGSGSGGGGSGHSGYVGSLDGLARVLSECTGRQLRLPTAVGTNNNEGAVTKVGEGESKNNNQVLGRVDDNMTITSFHSCQSSMIEDEKKTNTDDGKSDEEGWTCSKCTLLNPKLYLVCELCGTMAPSDDNVATTQQQPTGNDNVVSPPVKKTELQSAKDEKVQDDKARKKREKAERKKKAAEELARKREEERVAAEAEAEKNRQLEAKREKQAAMARYEAEVQHQQEQERQQQQRKRGANQKQDVQKSTLNVASAPFVPSVKGDGVKQSRPIAAKRRDVYKPSAAAKAKKTVSVDQLSFYIKSKPKKSKANVSPIFNLLQDKSTVEKGRRMLILEADAHACREELKELSGQKSALESGIEAEEKGIIDREKIINNLAKKTSNKFLMSMNNLFGGSSKAFEEELAAKDKEGDAELEKELAKLKSGEITLVEDESDSDEDSVSPVKNLDELIDGCVEHLTCSPQEYISWLHSEGIETISDLGIRVVVDDEKLAEGDGNAGIKPESKELFVSRVLDAMSAEGVEDKKGKGNELTNEQKEAMEKLRERQAQRVRKGMTEKARKKEEKKKSDRHKKAREARKRIENLRRVIEDAKKSILLQKGQLADLQGPISIKFKQLQKLRADIAEIKGEGIEEDINFHIDRSRDDRGFTFLMLAAQNDDFFTAKTCLALGADAYATSPEGLTAIDFSYFFEHEHITNVILQNGGSLPQKQSEAWKSLQSMAPQSADSSRNWDDALKVADTAALPAETLMESPEKCEADEDKRMNILTDERSSMDFTCFESRLLDPNINSDQVHRVVLLEQQVYNWVQTTDPTTRSNFINILEGLKPASIRRQGIKSTVVHRRSIVGTTTTFEVLASRFDDVSTQEKKDEVVLFSPFVSGEVEGVTSIGVLVWVVAPDSEASLHKTLVENTEFMRHKVEQDDRFLPQKGEVVLKLGKDMHLLDLQSTSIWTTAAMGLYILNVDQGDLDRISEPGFSAKKRIVHSEEQVNKAIFRTNQEEAEESAGILATERLDMSSLISGGAGTGKTLLMIRKVASEDPSRRVLVVSRLPRLVNIIKTAVEEKREANIDNLSFTTYDDLVQLLVRRVVPDDDSQYESFVQFDRIRFDCDDSNVSFSQEFIGKFLNSKEQRQMKSQEIEPLTLWHAIIVIKSNSKCAATKEPLSLDDYIALPPSFGLTEVQRRLCFDLFLKYEQWRKDGRYWDEMDRVLYVMRHGPSVFREDEFIPWTSRVNKFGQMELLDDEGAPLYPFFYDVVCADEAQDFTEIDLLLFTKMSASIRSLFLSADVAQSVELGVNMREGTVNDVFHSLLKDGKQQVKDVLQYIGLRTNHRTHAQNLAIGQAIRKILARSFKIPRSVEVALINGELPKTLMIKKIKDLADTSIFQGGNIVFLAPDEKVHELRLQFQALEIHNDLFGVREAKGLEFDACALIGFFGLIEQLGSKEEWQNVLRWLSSESNITKTSNTGEKIDGLMLTDCDYRLSAPNVSDEAMMLYTALTRARNHLYLIEVENTGGRGKKQGKPLAQYAFRRLTDLGLAKSVSFIREGHVEMTPAQHKARGVLYVTQALNMSRNMEPVSSVKDKFLEAMNRFGPDKGNDKDLLDKCEKHLDAVMQMRNIMRFAKDEFLNDGEYNLEGRFAEVLEFEQKASRFFSLFLCDSFLVTEVHNVRLLIEEVFDGTPYEEHFKNICATVKNLENGI